MTKRDLTHTEEVEQIAEELGIEFSVALDIAYLRSLEARIVAAAKKYPKMRDFLVENVALEDQLKGLEPDA